MIAVTSPISRPRAVESSVVARTRFVQGDGVRLAVTERGSVRAPVLVLVHGYPDSQRVWSRVAERLADRYRVVTYDVRGGGGSEAPASWRGYALEHLARDLEAVIDAVAPASGDRRVHLVGHDWGSIQAWEAVTDPRMLAKVKSFTSISGPCLDHVGAWLRSGASAGDALRQASRSWYIGAMHAGAAVPGAWGALVARGLPYLQALTEGVARDREREATLASDAKNGIGLYLANIGPRLLDPRERTTEIPVQLVAPNGDPYISAAVTRDVGRFAKTLFRREVVGGHWQPLAHPERVARWIADLVAHVEGTRADPSFVRLREAEPRRLVLVTGGASGIGRETCFSFANEGADVVVADRDMRGAERTAELCRLLGSRAVAREVDVASEASMSAFADVVLREDGVPDVLVLNAGIGVAGRFLDTTAEEWDKVLGVNVLGVARGARLFGKAMVERGQGGHVVVTASAAAFTPSKVLPAYAASKAAALMLAECMRAELAEDGIGVSAICPGLIDTPITRATTYAGASAAEADAKRKKAERLYRRRGVGPEVVARAIVRAVREDRPLVPVATEAHVLRAVSRVAPGILRRLARTLEM